MDDFSKGEESRGEQRREVESREAAASRRVQNKNDCVDQRGGKEESGKRQTFGDIVVRNAFSYQRTCTGPLGTASLAIDP